MISYEGESREWAAAERAQNEHRAVEENGFAENNSSPFSNIIHTYCIYI